MKTVETDKLREEFQTFMEEESVDFFIINKKHNEIFDWFLPYLSVSKEVEVSDGEIEKDDSVFALAEKLADEAFGNKGRYLYSERQELTSVFNAILLEYVLELFNRDKQGIAPKEVEEKCIGFAEWISKHKYKHLITPAPGRSVWKADGGENYSLPYLFKQFIKEGET